MICITADIHHPSLGNKDAMSLNGSEMESALIYADILSSFNIKCTFFVTGLTAVQESIHLKRLSKNNDFEIGGHTYYGFKYRRMYNLWRKITGNSNGPACFQNWEIKKTIHVLETVCGKTVKSWRDHAFRHDKNTRKLLTMNGILYFSDIVDPDMNQPKRDPLTGIIDVPVNNLTDNDFIKRQGYSDSGPRRVTVGGFCDEVMSPKTWLDKTLRNVDNTVNSGGLATILVHPATMAVTDKFNTFTELCSKLSKYKSICMNEIGKEYNDI